MKKESLLQAVRPYKANIISLSAWELVQALLILAIAGITAGIFRKFYQEEFAAAVPLMVVLLFVMWLRAGVEALLGRRCRQLSSRVQLYWRQQCHRVIFARPTAAVELMAMTCEAVRELEQFFTRVIPSVLALVWRSLLLGGAALLLDPLSGAMFFATLPIALFLLYLTGQLTKEKNRQQWQRLLELNEKFADILAGALTVKLFRQSQRELQRLRQAGEAFSQSSLAVLQQAFMSAFITELITTLAIALVAVGEGLRLINGQMDFYTAFFVLLLAPEFYQPVRQLGTAFHSGLNARAAYERLQDFSLPHRAKGRQAVAALGDDGREIAKADGGLTISDEERTIPPDVEIEELTFAYGSGYYPVFHGLSLAFPAGQLTVINGVSGKGKSTLLKLLAGILPAAAGQIKINGRPMEGLSRDVLYKIITYVPQEPWVMPASLRDNVTLWGGVDHKATSPEGQGSRDIPILWGEADWKDAKYQAHDKQEKNNDEAIVIALQQAGLGKWLAELPQGLDTMLGEAGHGLSNGQRKRLGLARAFWQAKTLVLLDEPTAGLDETTEKYVLQSLASLAKGRTVIAVSHRPALLEMADYVVTLDEATIG